MIAAKLLKLTQASRTDTSTIVSDYSIDALGNLAKTSEKAADSVYSILKEALQRLQTRSGKSPARWKSMTKRPCAKRPK